MGDPGGWGYGARCFLSQRWGTEDGVLLVRYLAMSLSRTYLDAVFFFVSCVFCLICSLHIIKLRHYFKLLQVPRSPPPGTSTPA